MTKHITQEQLDAMQDAYYLGVEDAKVGRYSPTAYYHYNDTERIRQYDAGHATVVTLDWRWSMALPAEAVSA